MDVSEGEGVGAKSDKEIVKDELKDVQSFVSGLKIDDLKGGAWFEKLLTKALSTYSTKVDAEYFRKKYPDLPADAVVQERIEMAARYAAIEGGLTSAAYTSAIALTISSGGGASPLALPAGGTAFVVDLVYLSQAQIKLAYDISVLYQVPLDLDDPDDLWKLIRIAFAIRLGEGAGVAAIKGVPAVVRPFVKKYYSKGVLGAARSLPVIGKYLLQRNVIKFAIPVVSIPSTVAVNSWVTKTTGRQAQKLMRLEAKLFESATRIVDDNSSYIELLWTMWMTMNANGQTTEDQRTLLHHVTSQAKIHGVSGDELAKFRNVVELDEQSVWKRLARIDDLNPVYDAAVVSAVVSGKPSEDSLRVLQKIAALGNIEFDRRKVDVARREWGSPLNKDKKKRKHQLS